MRRFFLKYSDNFKEFKISQRLSIPAKLSEALVSVISRAGASGAIFG